MLRLILYKELREIIGSAKFAVTFGICSLLIILAFFTGIENYKTGMEEYNASEAAQLRTHEKKTDWREVRNHQVYLTPKPLAALVMGVSNDLGRTAYITGSSIPPLDDSIYSQQPVFAVFRFLDLEFVFQVILSLFAILFAFDAINGEKERGTLRLSFANSLPRASYILGKLTGSFLALALPLLIPILIGVLLLPLSGVALSTEEWARLGLFILCGLLYLGVFLTLSVFISCLTQRSSSSFLFLLVIWVCSVLIIPRASVLIAGNMIDVPSMEEVSVQRLQLQRQNSREYIQKLNDLYRDFFQQMSQNRDNSREATDRGFKKISDTLDKIRAENDKSVKDLTSRLNEERRNIQIKQEKLAFGISRISPTAVFTLAATTFSGTSLELREHFRERAAAYSDSFAEFYRKNRLQYWRHGCDKIETGRRRETTEAHKHQGNP
ncbi:ABC transporter permease [Thermodesulfobacteriota bacterium]